MCYYIMCAAAENAAVEICEEKFSLSRDIGLIMKFNRQHRATVKYNCS